jgi:acyl dehydratase
MTMQTQTAERARLYLEDLQPGQVHRSSGAPASVDADGIKAYARQFDPQPFHLDEVAAGQSLFHGLVASGWHTAAMTMLLLVESGLPLAGGIIGAGVEDMRWPRPVRPGDRLRVESEVLEVRPSRSKPEQGIAKIRTTTLNQNDEPVQIMTSNLVVQRRGTGAASVS